MAGREWSLPAFGARVQEHARRLGLAGFWQWWKRQLDALMPAAPRAALARRRMRPVLVFAGDSATLWRLATANGQPVMAVATTIPLTGDAATIAAAGRAALAPLTHAVYGAPAASARVVISLPARDVLRRNIVLPSAVEENFRQALAYDLDRHTPFKPEELYFDATIVARDAVHNTITIDLAAARRAIVDPALKHAAAWGADVAAVVPEPPDRAAGSRLNLLPADARTSSSAWTRWQFWVPIAVLAAATLAAVVIPLWQKREYVMQLNPLADQARRRAAVSETLRAELDARVGRLQHGARAQVRVSQRPAGRRRREQAPARRHVAHAVRNEDACPRARKCSAICWSAARRRTPDGWCNCSRSRNCSRKPRRGRRRPRSSLVPAKYSTSVRSSRRGRCPRRWRWRWPTRRPRRRHRHRRRLRRAGRRPERRRPPARHRRRRRLPREPRRRRRAPSTAVPAAGNCAASAGDCAACRGSRRRLPREPRRRPSAGDRAACRGSRAAGNPPPSTAAPAPAAAAAAPGAPAPGLRARPADAGAPPPANPLSPALAPPADAGNASGNGGGRKP